MREQPANETRYNTYQDWKRWSTKEFAEYDQKTQYYFKKLLSRLRSQKYSKILEIGFGNGSLAGWLKTFHPSASWTGIEVQQTLVEKAKNAGFDASSNLDQLPARKQFDVIVALDVIEHLSDSEIEKVLKLLMIFEIRKTVSSILDKFSWKYFSSNSFSSNFIFSNPVLAAMIEIGLLIS